MGTISELKNKVDIVDFIVKDGVVLRHGGANIYKGLCPFHHEKTPSFVVYKDNSTFHCFGCKTHGDIIDYVANRNSLTKMQAIQFLADQYNFELDLKNNKDDYAKQKRLTELLTKIDEYFKYNFSCLPEEHPAKQQIIQRNLPITSAYGYCPSNEQFNRYFNAQGYTQEELQEVGVNTEHGYCRFSDRLIFTICNIFGQAIGFTGRQLIDNKKAGKYINSANTLIFDKSKVLYGVERARFKAREDNAIYLVEGQFDVEAMHNAGYTNTVAVSGSAFSKEQEKLILNIIGNDGKIILMLDGDQAGKKAMNHIFCKFPELHNMLYIALLPAGVDPCELLQQGLPLPKVKSITKTYYNAIKSKFLVDDTPESKTIYIQKIQKLFTNYIEDKVLKNNYLKKAAEDVGVQYEDLNITSKRDYNKKTDGLRPSIKSSLLALKVYFDTQNTNGIKLNPKDYNDVYILRLIKELYDNEMVEIEGLNKKKTRIIDRDALTEQSQKVLDKINEQEYEVLTDKIFIQSYYRSLIEQAKAESIKEKYENVKQK